MSFPDLAALLAGDGGLPGTVLAVLPAAGDGAQDAAGLAAGVLRLLQDWLAEPRLAGSHLAVITAGAVAAAPGDAPCLSHAAARGLVRSAQSENPGRVTLLDTDRDPASDAATTAALEHARAHGEPELALRHGTAHTPRLTPTPTPPPATTQRRSTLVGWCWLLGGRGWWGGWLPVIWCLCTVFVTCCWLAVVAVVPWVRRSWGRSWPGWARALPSPRVMSPRGPMWTRWSPRCPGSIR